MTVANNEILISINNLTKSFLNGREKLRVINDLNINICSNEFISLLGPSGCGKSTLIDIVLGHKDYEKGSISFNTISQNSIAVVWQEDFLIPWKTIYQNLEYPLIIKKIEKEQRKKIIDFWLDNIDLKKFSSYYPHQLSQGMKKRVSIASILVTNPNIIFFDEPFTGLDSDTKKNIQSVIYNIWEKMKLSIVLVTHDIQEAVSMSNRILVMSKSPSSIVYEERLNLRKDFNGQFKDDNFYKTVRRLTQKLERVW